MSTWWKLAARVDIGLDEDDMSGNPFSVTNRGWYFLYRLLVKAGARRTDMLAGKDEYITANLANHWGEILVTTQLGDWVQVGRWDGRAVVPMGIMPLAEAQSLMDTHELTPLHSTPVSLWLSTIGRELAATPTGYVISGKPRKVQPMSVNLSKGDKSDLVKEAGGTLTKVRVGLGWDARKTAGEAYDLDASVVGLADTGFAVSPDWFVFYKNLNSPNGAIAHQGDNLTGAGDGDDEQIVIDLTKLPAEVTDLRFLVTIYDAKARGNQSFSLVDNAFIRVIDESTGKELARYDLSEDTASGVNALEFAKLYRHNGAWLFKALGDGFTEELGGLVNTYKI